METKNPGDFVAISVSETEEKSPARCCAVLASVIRRTIAGEICADDSRKLFHAAKVGLALVLVSLLYMLEVVHDRLGDNAMWAVMTVVVIFESTAGATISKGINRVLGTMLGGGLGFSVAFLAQGISGAGKAVVIGISVFVFCSTATYIRMIPSIKKKHDYGAMIFILTYSLVAVSGVRSNQIIKIASDRLSSIFIGFAVCIFISLFIFPIWCGDELHNSLASKFDNLACSIEGLSQKYSHF
ncbi:aluminum-activated malate transporter 12-like [Asparagus officinalis]|uniref:aluminum-activated malate transporter 12-like n=1 Tax=Asparagus officinalis TaxID=4686 RepID=UPI00098E37B3|nr:aluminum-activated malate transporter 12-like [Asparagus officinalis]